MKRSKQGIGHFLLKNFQKTQVLFRSRPTKKKSPAQNPALRLSEWNQPRPSKKVAKKIDSTEEASTFSQDSQDSQASQISGPILVPTLQPEVWHEKSLEIKDILKPNDALRQSIEAFILDQRSVHTRRAYGKDLKRFVQFLLVKNYHHEASLKTINRTVIIAYKESLLSEGLEHTTVDRHLATLRSFFQWLVDDGHIDKSPAQGVRFLNPKKISRTNGFTDEEVNKILKVPNLHRRVGAMHYAVLMVLFYCGLRRSELCELNVSQIGVERGQQLLRLRGKGNAERIIVMIPPVWHAIQHYFRMTQRDSSLSLSKDEPLFMPLRNNRTGVLKKPLDPSMVFYIVTRYARLAGVVNRVSPHSCRATAISNARDHQVSDRAIQEFAGWSSPDMITRYDKRKNSIENSASFGIFYGEEGRYVPEQSDKSK